MISLTNKEIDWEVNKKIRSLNNKLNKLTSRYLNQQFQNKPKKKTSYLNFCQKLETTTPNPHPNGNTTLVNGLTFKNGVCNLSNKTIPEEVHRIISFGEKFVPNQNV